MIVLCGGTIQVLEADIMLFVLSRPASIFRTATLLAWGVIRVIWLGPLLDSPVGKAGFAWSEEMMRERLTSVPSWDEN